MSTEGFALAHVFRVEPLAHLRALSASFVMPKTTFASRRTALSGLELQALWFESAGAASDRLRSDDRTITERSLQPHRSSRTRGRLHERRLNRMPHACSWALVEPPATSVTTTIPYAQAALAANAAMNAAIHAASAAAAC